MASCSTQDKPVLDVPYVPTKQSVVNAMLKMANVKQGDVLYDLGCGDGRIVVTVAKEYGATGTIYYLFLDCTWSKRKIIYLEPPHYLSIQKS